MFVFQIYWLGPIAGGIVGAVLYDSVFAVDASARKLATCCGDNIMDHGCHSSHGKHDEMPEKDNINQEFASSSNMRKK